MRRFILHPTGGNPMSSAMLQEECEDYTIVPDKDEFLQQSSVELLPFQKEFEYFSVLHEIEKA